MSDQYPEEAEALISPWFMQHTKEEILQLCLENRIPCVPVRTFDEVMVEPQLEQRDYFQEMEHPEAGALRYPGAPYRLAGSPSRAVRPAPTLGQDNALILCDELGLARSELPELARTGII
jgi:crotonobetainyl-CoA:carnitine CoA-transferase CaiB-like acyl-CoA transferase